jgi:hypothetical protein
MLTATRRKLNRLRSQIKSALIHLETMVNAPSFVNPDADTEEEDSNWGVFTDSNEGGALGKCLYTIQIVRSRRDSRRCLETRDRQFK